MEIALNEIFVLIFVDTMWIEREEMPFFSLVIFIIRLQCNIKYFLVNSQWITR